ncbi:hypothetical protein [Acinetobacter rudis]|uniref:Uncharacterized protein n=1 Tax=Acinetobacter rudis TaxID=632955 RepID=A0AAW8J8J8_9GAMM|nr:hypothetical protein [Acinetobacter rudis]MDQ8935505.1 hypothetical protein [Acinetobacter rudis]MDQ9017728.1 hypothetical protein [Acinetobacter rudis]
MNEFEQLKLYLTNRDGYLRQKSLIALKNNFKPDVFPLLLRCLSDYVEANRQAAEENLKVWSKQQGFSKLCIDYFEDVIAIQDRVRRMRDIEQIIFESILSNLGYLQQVMFGQQGHRVRSIFQHVKKYQWINLLELERLCKFAKDPMLRVFWLQGVLHRNQTDELKNEFRQSSFGDIQRQLLQTLHLNGSLETETLLLAWQSKYKSVMDYACFVLKGRGFNFKAYFNQYPISSLDNHQEKIRVRQLMLMKWDKNELLQLISLTSNEELRAHVLISSLKSNYLSMEDIIYLSTLTYVQLNFSLQYIECLLRALTKQITVDELTILLGLTHECPSLLSKLGYLKYLDYWDRLYWIICLIEDDREHQPQVAYDLQQLLDEAIRDGRYVLFAPDSSWLPARIERVYAAILQHFQKQISPLQLSDYQKMLNILKKRCSL